MGIDRDVSGCSLCRGGEESRRLGGSNSSAASDGYVGAMIVSDMKETKVANRNGGWRGYCAC
jgi:hypothetical protein